MKLLVLGGTVFLGRHVVEEALKRGWEVTLFNRGKSNPALFASEGVEVVQGDRDGGLGVLASRRWDLVVDTCGYVPRLVGDAARFLADAVERYVFVSSVSVYANFDADLIGEDAPVIVLDDPSVEEITGATYGGLKALCEQAAEEAMPGRVLNVRAGLIVGPWDASDRFTWWAMRAAQPGPFLGPGAPSDQVQCIDARDLAVWMLDAGKAGCSGAFNATSDGMSMERFVGAVAQAGGHGDASIRWVSHEVLQDAGVGAFAELPLWVPPEARGIMRADVGKAVGAGLKCRPLADTLRDTLEWAKEHRSSGELGAGLSKAREAQLMGLVESGGDR